jgi:hypothetical protein
MNMKPIYRSLAVTCMGWYLMLPPAAQRNGIPWPDGRAPISQWKIAQSFDSATACEKELDKHRKKFETNYRKANAATPAAQFWAQFYVAAAGDANCIETDDPRLKADSPAETSHVENSQTN